MKTVETRGEIMDNIIFALPKADIIGHRRTSLRKTVDGLRIKW